MGHLHTTIITSCGSKIFKKLKVSKTYLGCININQTHWSERLLVLVNGEFGGKMREKNEIQSEFLQQK